VRQCALQEPDDDVAAVETEAVPAGPEVLSKLPSLDTVMKEEVPELSEPEDEDQLPATAAKEPSNKKPMKLKKDKVRCMSAGPSTMRASTSKSLHAHCICLSEQSTG